MMNERVVNIKCMKSTSLAKYTNYKFTSPQGKARKYLPVKNAALEPRAHQGASNETAQN